MPLTDEQWEQVKQSIWSAERSNGDYTSYNADSGAAGAYQFMPDTWREKANYYGYGAYANVPNASYAPSYIQDSVARGWASDLYDKYNGDMRYVLDAWISGESAADYDYERGYVSNTRNDGNITASEYVSRGYLPTEQTLNTELITTNNPDQSVTNTENLRPEAIYGANTIAYWVNSLTGNQLMITGGAELGYHAKSSTGHGHEDGWKIDIDGTGFEGGTESGTEFKSFCNENGWSCNWEGDHWDIDFSGQDSRDPQQGGFTGNFWGTFAGGLSYNPDFNYMEQLAQGYENSLLYQQQDKPPDYSNASWTEKLWDGIVDTATTTGSSYLLQSIYGNVFHSDNHFGKMDDITQADVDYVKEMFPDDKDTQMFVLLNGRDSQEIQFLANQKLEEKQRRERIEQYNDGCIMTIANAGRLIGGLADPLNYIPVGTAVAGLKIVGRLGTAIYDMSKVSRIASKAGRMGKVIQPALIAGTTNIPVSIADDALREKFGGVNLTAKDYGYDAVASFLGGAVVGGIGGLFSNIGRNRALEKMATTADYAETKAIQEAGGMLPTNTRDETISEALKLHDVNYGKTIKSKYYTKLEGNNRVVATTSDLAKNLLGRYGIDLPTEARAFYVPNEDYTILLTDKIKPKDIDSVLAHEFGVHAGLRATVGDKAYNELLDNVSRLANKDGTVFNQVRKDIGEYDPEEILASAIEQGKIPDNFVSKVKGLMNKAFKREGFNTRVSAQQVKEIMEQQIVAQRFAHNGIYFNPDGSTAFAGIRYSKDNILNPRNFAQYYMLDPEITSDTERDLWKGFKWFGRKAEQGFYGSSITSPSNTIRSYASMLYDDVRGRNLTNTTAIPAEINKERIIGLLTKPYMEYADIRMQWALRHKRLGEGAYKAFDRLVFDAYNAKYGGNTANVIKDIPEEVSQAIEKIHAYRQLQIEEGKHSSRNAGSRYANLIEDDWQPVDLELWRIVDPDKRTEFIAHFINPEKEIPEFLEKYYRTYAKRDVIRAKILRGIEKGNKKRKEFNDSIPKDSKREPMEMLSTNVSEKDIDDWLDKHIDGAIKNLMKDTYDPTLASNLGTLRKLSFLQTRIPLDTTGVMKFKDGTEFSFDNNLRSFDMDNIILKNMQRFAGECSVTAVFGSQKNLDAVLSKAYRELGLTVEHGLNNRSRAKESYDEFVEGIQTLRGVKPRDAVLNRLSTLARIFTKEAYYTNGANMGFAQIGEVSGSVAYGGISHLFDMIKPVASYVENLKWGKETADVIRDVEAQMFGDTLERHIFNNNWGDRVVRDALTDRKDLISKALRGTSSALTNLSKVTSALNFLPKMTDSMIRKMRNQTIMDSIRWSNGEDLGIFRRPFSKAKLRGCRMSAKEAESIQADIRKYTTRTTDGKIKGVDIQKWQQENWQTYNKWRYMVQKQADRAIISGTRIGNKNLFKDKNALTRMMLQFKDYSLRAINAQTFRVLTARDLDDAMQTVLSMFTNAAGYALKAGATLAAMKATGADEKAQEYYDRMFTPENLIRAGILRSAVIGSPFSLGNDILEATGLVNSSIRTTVTRGNWGSPQDLNDYVSNVLAQMPAMQQAGKLLDIANYFYHEGQDNATQRDFRRFIQAFPIPNFIPTTAIFNKFLIENSEYPERRPKD